MTKDQINTVAEYVKSLPVDRRRQIAAVRKVIRDHLPVGYRECFAYGMIGYVVPLARYPHTHNRQPLMLAALASQKNHMAVYLMCAYGHKETRDWFVARYKASGKRLDMGKSCVRFRTIDDLPLDLIGETITRVSVEQYIDFYEKSRKK